MNIRKLLLALTAFTVLAMCVRAGMVTDPTPLRRFNGDILTVWGDVDETDSPKMKFYYSVESNSGGDDVATTRLELHKASIVDHGVDHCLDNLGLYVLAPIIYDDVIPGMILPFGDAVSDTLCVLYHDLDDIFIMMSGSTMEPVEITPEMFTSMNSTIRSSYFHTAMAIEYFTPYLPANPIFDVTWRLFEDGVNGQNYAVLGWTTDRESMPESGMEYTNIQRIFFSTDYSLPVYSTHAIGEKDVVGVSFVPFSNSFFAAYYSDGNVFVQRHQINGDTGEWFVGEIESISTPIMQVPQMMQLNMTNADEMSSATASVTDTADVRNTALLVYAVVGSDGSSVLYGKVYDIAGTLVKDAFEIATIPITFVEGEVANFDAIISGYTTDAQPVLEVMYPNVNSYGEVVVGKSVVDVPLSSLANTTMVLDPNCTNSKILFAATPANDQATFVAKSVQGGYFYEKSDASMSPVASFTLAQVNSDEIKFKCTNNNIGVNMPSFSVSVDASPYQSGDVVISADYFPSDTSKSGMGTGTIVAIVGVSGLVVCAAVIALSGASKARNATQMTTLNGDGTHSGGDYTSVGPTDSSRISSGGNTTGYGTVNDSVAEDSVVVQYAAPNKPAARPAPASTGAPAPASTGAPAPASTGTAARTGALSEAKPAERPQSAAGAPAPPVRPEGKPTDTDEWSQANQGANGGVTWRLH